MEARIDRVDVSVYKVPTDFPESDGTLEWNATTMVLVEVSAGRERGLGFSYTSGGAAILIQEKLVEYIQNSDAMDINGIWCRMMNAVRNFGRAGIASTAISACDIALWDLKARLLKLPVVKLLGQVRENIAGYGSGGFTSYSKEQLQRQLSGWIQQGFRAVKIKIGRQPDRDLERVRWSRESIGNTPELFVDANGAYSRKQALYFAEAFRDHGVTWFEEPVSSDDLEGLRLLRNRVPSPIDIAAGEYGYDSFYFRRMLEAEAVDVLQADATRCGGITGILKAGVLAEAESMPLSAHTSPSVHSHVCCAIGCARNVEFFHDHARIERMLFDGAVEPVNGNLRPDVTRLGLGLEFKRADAAQYAL